MTISFARDQFPPALVAVAYSALGRCCRSVGTLEFPLRADFVEKVTCRADSLLI